MQYATSPYSVLGKVWSRSTHTPLTIGQIGKVIYGNLYVTRNGRHGRTSDGIIQVHFTPPPMLVSRLIIYPVR